MLSDHKCPRTPNAISFWKHRIDGMMMTFDYQGYRGGDSGVYVDWHFDVPVTYCPFCGKKIRGKEGELDD